ncbi:MAG: DNA polymerase III subunit delta, partial [Clostridiales bacterium]|nr:DNA polymerase III subunit delta [Clostridiales bacterium]
MNHTSFFKHLKEGKIDGCYVFEGQEEYVKETALASLKKHLLDPEFETLNWVTLENPPMDEVVAAAQTLPFMAEKRLLVVKNSELLVSGKGKNEEKQMDMIETLLRALPQTLCLVFYVQGKTDGRKKLTSLLKKMGTWVSFNPLEERELIRWIGQTFKGLKKEITPALAQEFAFIVGNDGTTLRREIEKTASFLGEEKQVTSQSIRQVATPSVEYTIFDLVDAVVAGNQERTFVLKKQLIHQGVERLNVLAMLLRQYRILLFAKGMTNEKKTKEEIRKMLGIPAFALERTLRQGHSYTVEELKKGVKICLDAEYEMKSGKLPQEG